MNLIYFSTLINFQDTEGEYMELTLYEVEERPIIS